MSEWAVIFLGIIAVATLAMAIMQIGLIVYSNRLLRRMTSMLEHIERELQPLFSAANLIARDAARAASLAASLVEMIQGTILAPARKGRALWAVLRVLLGALRATRSGPPKSGAAEDEESLFI